MEEETLNKWKEIRELLSVVESKFNEFSYHMNNFAEIVQQIKH